MPAVSNAAYLEYGLYNSIDSMGPGYDRPKVSNALNGLDLQPSPRDRRVYHNTRIPIVRLKRVNDASDLNLRVVRVDGLADSTDDHEFGVEENPLDARPCKSQEIFDSLDVQTVFVCHQKD